MAYSYNNCIPPSTSPYSVYSAYPNTGMNAPEYGQPGSFAGRKSVQPPGGYSSISFGDANAGYNQSGYSSMGAGGVSSAAYGRSIQSYPSYQAPGYGYPQQDLSAQLNIPGYLRPPSSGRRALSQPTVSGYSPGYGGAGNYGAGPGLGAYKAYSSSYASPSGQYAPSSYKSQPSAYGAYGAGGLQGYGASPSGYGASAYGAAPSYLSSAYGGGSSPSGYGASAYGAGRAVYPVGGSSYIGAVSMYGPPSPAQFHAGQKGQFGGKIIQQPPGGRTSIQFG